MSNLNPQQFTVYEVGDDMEKPGYKSTRYDIKADTVSPEHFGMKVAGARDTSWGNQGFEATPHEERDIPLDKVILAQNYVYKPHVENLATVPQESFHATQKYDPVTAVALPDGRFLVDHGTHRTTAAVVRGDKTVRVRLGGRYT
jgi:hypothetical protein